MSAPRAAQRLFLMSPTLPTSTRGLRRAAWSRAMEARALQVPGDQLKGAIANWHHMGDQAQQLALVRENAQTRGPELTLAYRNVVHVTSGYRKRRSRSGAERLVAEPCVVFVVRKKWAQGERAADDLQRLPAHLMAWASIDGQRVLCALPTDVQPEADLFGVRPRGASMGWTDEPDFPETGTLACVLEVSEGGQRLRFALSALHVFSPQPHIDPPAASNGRAFLPLSASGAPLHAPPIVSTVEFGGALRDSSSGLPSFDVQLARIESPARVRAALADMPLSRQQPFITDEAMFERLASQHFFDLVVPENHPDRPQTPRPRMVCEFSRWLNRAQTIPYNARRGTTRVVCNALHTQLVEMKIRGPNQPLPGDSGCALVVYLGDGTCTLAGLFIASHDKLPFAYAIPAWHLFDPSAYFDLPDGASLRPVNP